MNNNLLKALIVFLLLANLPFTSFSQIDLKGKRSWKLNIQTNIVPSLDIDVFNPNPNQPVDINAIGLSSRSVLGYELGLVRYWHFSKWSMGWGVSGGVYPHQYSLRAPQAFIGRGMTYNFDSEYKDFTPFYLSSTIYGDYTLWSKNDLLVNIGGGLSVNRFIGRSRLNQLGASVLNTTVGGEYESIEIFDLSYSLSPRKKSSLGAEIYTELHKTFGNKFALSIALFGKYVNTKVIEHDDSRLVVYGEEYAIGGSIEQKNIHWGLRLGASYIFFKEQRKEEKKKRNYENVYKNRIGLELRIHQTPSLAILADLPNTINYYSKPSVAIEQRLTYQRAINQPIKLGVNLMTGIYGYYQNLNISEEFSNNRSHRIASATMNETYFGGSVDAEYTFFQKHRHAFALKAGLGYVVFDGGGGTVFTDGQIVYDATAPNFLAVEDAENYIIYMDTTEKGGFLIGELSLIYRFDFTERFGISLAVNSLISGNKNLYNGTFNIFNDTESYTGTSTKKFRYAGLGLGLYYAFGSKDF